MKNNKNNNNNNNGPLVQWSFLQYKKQSNGINNNSEPIECFLHSATQIGSKILIYGGCGELSFTTTTTTTTTIDFYNNNNRFLQQQ